MDILSRKRSVVPYVSAVLPQVPAAAVIWTAEKNKTFEMQKLTNSQLNYMLCIRALTAEGIVRATDISNRIGLSMPSVHNMLGTLEGLGVVEKHRHAVYLTDAGRRTLDYYDTAVVAAEKLLNSVGITNCKDDALALVTALSVPAVEKLIENMM